MGLTGRTKAALVFGEGAQAQCVLATVVARALGGTRSGGLHISGPVTFDAHLAWHTRGVILPLVASVAESLGLPKRGLELSVVNLGAASALDLPAHIHGFSADVPLFLALLSAHLGLPVPPEVVSTGHSASAGGDQGQATLDALLSELDSASLARTIGLPIDTARATYVLDRTTVASHEEFLDTVSAFHLHVCRYGDGGPVPPEVVKDEALALLQAAFADRGGVEAALAEARTPIHGGMRHILDALEERTIAREVAIPHDEVRMRYSLRSNTVRDFNEFTDLTGDYYNYHFTRCLSGGGSLSKTETCGRAKEILESEYRRRGGGITTAFNDAHEGTNGGMRAILDLLAERLKAESVQRATSGTSSTARWPRIPGKTRSRSFASSSPSAAGNCLPPCGRTSPSGTPMISNP